MQGVIDPTDLEAPARRSRPSVVLTSSRTRSTASAKSTGADRVGVEPAG